MTTDAQLKQDATNELKWEPAVNETHIGVSVKNGVVTLTGHVTNYGAIIDASRIVVDAQDGKVTLRGRVHSLTEKNDAQYAAWSAPGVFAVENDLVVSA